MPGSFDLPREKLFTYEGRNPRPVDFDPYWDDALAELARHDAAPQLVPNHEFPCQVAECFDLWFTGVGGARVHAKYLRPRQRDTRGPAVLEFHGYTWHSGDWMAKLAYVSEGFHVVALDCRGQGGKSDDRGNVNGSTVNGHVVRGVEDPDPKNLYYRQVFLDTVWLARWAMQQPEIDPERMGTLGGSQGGALALACAALEPRVRRVACAYPFLCDYQRVWELDLAREAYGELRHFFRWRDPLHERESEIFTRLGYIDVQYLAPRIRAEVLMLTGLDDMVCPPSTQFAVYNKITAPKRVVFYSDFAHENLPGGTDLFFQHLRPLADKLS